MCNACHLTLRLTTPPAQLHLSVTRIAPTLAWSTTIKNPNPMSEASLIAVAVGLCVYIFFFCSRMLQLQLFLVHGAKSGMDFCCWLCCSCRSLPPAPVACLVFRAIFRAIFRAVFVIFVAVAAARLYFHYITSRSGPS